MKLARVLVVGLLAMFALSLAAASALAEGSADEFEGTGAFSGSQSTTNLFTTHAGKVECKEATFKGTLKGSASSVEVTPTYKNCKAFGLTATVTTTGCKYKFSNPVDLKAEAEDTLHEAEVAVVCETGKNIIVKALGCEAKVGSQSGLKKVEAEKEGTGLLVKANVSGIAYTLKGATCGGEGSFTEGTYEGNVKASPLAVN